MAKEEQATIGLNKPTIAMIVLILSVLAASAFWKDRGGAEAAVHSSTDAAVDSNTYRNDLQDKAIASNRKGVSDNKNNLHRQEVARVKFEGKVDQILVQQDKFIEYLMQYDYDKKKEMK